MRRPVPRLISTCRPLQASDRAVEGQGQGQDPTEDIFPIPQVFQAHHLDQSVLDFRSQGHHKTRLNIYSSGLWV